MVYNAVLEPSKLHYLYIRDVSVFFFRRYELFLFNLLTRPQALSKNIAMGITYHIYSCKVSDNFFFLFWENERELEKEKKESFI